MFCQGTPKVRCGQGHAGAVQTWRGSSVGGRIPSVDNINGMPFECNAIQGD